MRPVAALPVETPVILSGVFLFFLHRVTDCAASPLSDGYYNSSTNTKSLFWAAVRHLHADIMHDPVPRLPTLTRPRDMFFPNDVIPFSPPSTTLGCDSPPPPAPSGSQGYLHSRLVETYFPDTNLFPLKYRMIVLFREPMLILGIRRWEKCRCLPTSSHAHIIHCRC